MGRSCIKLSTASADGSTANWPLGLFLSEHTFAIIVFGAIPTYNETFTTTVAPPKTHRHRLQPLLYFRVNPLCASTMSKLLGTRDTNRLANQ